MRCFFFSSVFSPRPRKSVILRFGPGVREDWSRVDMYDLSRNFPGVFHVCGKTVDLYAAICPPVRLHLSKNIRKRFLWITLVNIENITVATLPGINQTKEFNKTDTLLNRRSHYTLYLVYTSSGSDKDTFWNNLRANKRRIQSRDLIDTATENIFIELEDQR